MGWVGSNPRFGVGSNLYPCVWFRDLVGWVGSILCFGDGSNPSHVWSIVLGWVGSISFFCLVGGIGKKGSDGIFDTVCYSTHGSHLSGSHPIFFLTAADPPSARRRRRRPPRLRPRPRVPLAEHAADLRRPRPRPRTPLAQPAADLRRPHPWPRAPLAEPAADLRRPGPRPRALLAEPAPTSAAPARGRAGQAVRRPGHAVGGGAGQAD